MHGAVVLTVCDRYCSVVLWTNPKTSLIRMCVCVCVCERLHWNLKTHWYKWRIKRRRELKTIAEAMCWIENGCMIYNVGPRLYYDSRNLRCIVMFSPGKDEISIWPYALRDREWKRVQMKSCYQHICSIHPPPVPPTIVTTLIYEIWIC